MVSLNISTEQLQAFPGGSFFARQEQNLAVPKFDRVAFFMTLLLFGGYLVPSELSVRAGLLMTGHRFTIILCAFALIFLQKRKFDEKKFKLMASDIVVFGLLFWCPIATMISSGASAVASSLGQTGFEVAVSYGVGRLVLGNVTALRSASQAIKIVSVCLLIMGFIDLAAGENIIARLSSLIGSSDRGVHIYADEAVSKVIVTQYRFGIVRVRGPIEHSILYGAYFVMVAPIIYYSTVSKIENVIYLILCGVGVAIAISSAPILAYVMMLCFVIYDALFNKVSYRWAILISILLFAILVTIMVAENPVDALISSATLDPSSGQARLLIWKWIGHDVLVSPWYGLGTGDWPRPAYLLDTVDCLWLNLAYKFGYVGLALFLLTIVSSFFVIGPRRMQQFPSKYYSGPIIGIRMTMFLAIFVGFTVDFWGSIWSFFGCAIGIHAGLIEAGYLPRNLRGGI